MKIRFSTLMLFAAHIAFSQPTNTSPLLPPRPELPPTIWEQHGALIVLLGIVLVALAGFCVWLILRPKPVVPLPIEIQTRNELELLRLPTEDGKTISQVSQVLKRYMAVAFELQSGEMTTAEFSRAVAASEKAGNELAASVSEFLRQCDERKFSPIAGVRASACSRALEILEQGEARRLTLRHTTTDTKSSQPA